MKIVRQLFSKSTWRPFDSLETFCTKSWCHWKSAKLRSLLHGLWLFALSACRSLGYWGLTFESGMIENRIVLVTHCHQAFSLVSQSL